MSKVEIFYLSGTGNSLHVAKELQNRLQGSVLLPIASEMSKESRKANADVVGFIFPLHYLTLPRIVSDFVTKLDLSAAEYVFAIGTRGGTPSNAFQDMDKILKKKGKKLNSAFLVNMADNNMHFKGYVDLTPEKIAELDNEILIKLDTIETAIKNREPSREEDTQIIHPFSLALVKIMSVLTPLLTKKERTEFFCDEKCTGCGTCAMVCLANKITMKDNKPVWRKESPCYACFACINYCPMQAAQIKSMPALKSYTSVHGRYHHPAVTAQDIAAQKLS